ncbi:MAG: GTP-binding protein, partial [Promethearchaeota archaeon]
MSEKTNEQQILEKYSFEPADIPPYRFLYVLFCALIGFGLGYVTQLLWEGILWAILLGIIGFIVSIYKVRSNMLHPILMILMIMTESTIFGLILAVGAGRPLIEGILLFYQVGSCFSIIYALIAIFEWGNYKVDYSHKKDFYKCEFYYQFSSLDLTDSLWILHGVLLLFMGFGAAIGAIVGIFFFSILEFAALGCIIGAMFVFYVSTMFIVFDISNDTAGGRLGALVIFMGISSIIGSIVNVFLNIPFINDINYPFFGMRFGFVISLIIFLITFLKSPDKLNFSLRKFVIKNRISEEKDRRNLFKVIQLEREQKKKKKEKRRLEKRKSDEQKLLESLINVNAPTTSEEGLQILNRLQEGIDQFLIAKDYERALLLLGKKEEIYGIVIKLLEDINMTSIIPTLKEERNKNQKLLYKTQQMRWAKNYQPLSEELEKYQRDKDFSNIDKTIEEMKNSLGQIVKLSEDNEDTQSIAKYKGLIQELNELKEANLYAERYYNCEDEYNKILSLIDKGKMTSSLKSQQNLSEKIKKLQSEINSKVATNTQLHSISQTVDQLEKEIEQLRIRIQKIFEAQAKGLKKPKTDFSRMQATISIPKLTDVTVGEIKARLQAKVVLLGESSVGKTHIVLTMTGKEYGAMQGSTVGVDKFYKPVNISLPGYMSELCFWDLGGNWNFRAINELFLNEAQVIILMYDITREETFDSLQYWLDTVKATRWPGKEKIFIVGNKTDAGGGAINRKKIRSFLKINDLNQHYETSAKEGTYVDKLLEDITGSIDWSDLIKNVKPQIATAIGGILKTLRNEVKVIKTSKLLDILSEKLPSQDRLILKAGLRTFAAQDLIQFGRKDLYVVLDPVFIDKWMAKLI